MPDLPATTTELAELEAEGLLPSVSGSASPAWWALPHRHLFAEVADYLATAGRHDELARLVVDLRWVAARLARGGVSGVLTDLALVDDPVAARLARVMGRIGHRLHPDLPPAQVGPVLVNLLASAPDLEPLVDAYLPTLPGPHLTHRWPVADRDHPAMRRVLIAPSNAMVLAPDGTWLAAAGRDGVVQMWDTATRGQLATMDGHVGAVTALAVAANGSWLASAGADRTVRVWDPTGDALPRTLSGVEGLVTAMAAAPDGTTLALADDQQVWIHDIGGQSPPRRLAGQVTAMEFGPDGTWLVTLSENGSVRVWDLADGHARTVLEPVGGRDRFTTLAVAPDGTWLVTACRDNAAQVVDLGTGAVRTRLTGHTSVVSCAAIAPDGSWIATGSSDNDVRVWDAVTGEQRAVLPRNHGLVTAVAIAPGGTWLAAAGTVGTVHLWDAGGAPVAPIPYVHGVDAVAVAADGTWLAATVGRTVEQRSTVDGSPRSTFEIGCAARDVAVAPDGSWLATADDGVNIWDARTGSKRLALTRRFEGVLVHGLAVAPDGTWLAAVDSGDDRRDDADRHGKVRIWDTTTGELRATLTGHREEVRAVAVAPDGTWLVTGGTDGTLRTWDVATHAVRTTMPSRMHRVNAVVIAPDGDWLASAGSYEDIWFFDAATGADRARIRTRGASVTALAVSPDGTRLASVAWRSVQVWDVATRRLEVATQVADELSGCAWLPDGSGLCVAGRGGVHLLG